MIIAITGDPQNGRRTAGSGGWAFDAVGGRADRQRMGNESTNADGGGRTNGERINECGPRRAGQTVDDGRWPVEV